MKITVCQVLAVWRMAQTFHTEILVQVSRYWCSAHSVVVMEENHNIPKNTGTFSVVGLLQAF